MKCTITITITKDLITLAKVEMCISSPLTTPTHFVPQQKVLLYDINQMITTRGYSAYVTDHNNGNEVCKLSDFLNVLRKEG